MINVAPSRHTITADTNREIKVDCIRLEIHVPFIPVTQTEGFVSIEDNQGHQIGIVAVGNTYILETTGCCSCIDDNIILVFTISDIPVKKVTVTQWKEKCCNE
jgi:hypothetical protein